MGPEWAFARTTSVGRPTGVRNRVGSSEENQELFVLRKEGVGGGLEGSKVVFGYEQSAKARGESLREEGLREVEGVVEDIFRPLSRFSLCRGFHS